ncbi:MAG: hypothetical protein KJ066_19500 [Acidobacteria bacterium]|nr:hypothetical protein [Acidobacteriota bacterium]
MGIKVTKRTPDGTTTTSSVGTIPAVPQFPERDRRRRRAASERGVTVYVSGRGAVLQPFPTDEARVVPPPAPVAAPPGPATKSGKKR